jgi:pimeloyl-ACP methyl ester carboxylesterase
VSRLRRRSALALVGGAALVLLAIPERPSQSAGRWLRDSGLEPRFLDVDGMRVRYVRKGQGPALLLLHGMASSIYTWSEVLDGFAREHDVVALDLPGFGQSDQPAQLGFAALPRAVIGVMDSLALPRASLVGSSLGGAVAVAVAAERPERVERLVLIDAAGFNLRRQEWPWLVRALQAAPGVLLERAPFRRWLTRLALRQVFLDQSKVTDERVEEYVAPMLRAGAVRSLRSLLASAPGAGDGGFPALLARVTAPTLILWGKDDRWVPVADSERFASALKGSRTIVLRRCGHLPQEERPAETLALVRSFLASQ